MEIRAVAPVINKSADEIVRRTCILFCYGSYDSCEGHSQIIHIYNTIWLYMHAFVLTNVTLCDILSMELKRLLLFYMQLVTASLCEHQQRQFRRYFMEYRAELQLLGDLFRRAGSSVTTVFPGFAAAMAAAAW